jgi:hypothetical protein
MDFVWQQVARVQDPEEFLANSLAQWPSGAVQFAVVSSRSQPSSNRLLISDSFGRSWKVSEAKPTVGWWQDPHSNTNHTLLLLLNPGNRTVLRSFDQGLSFSEVKTGGSSALVHLYASADNAPTALVTTATTTLYLSTDGGATFNSMAKDRVDNAVVETKAITYIAKGELFRTTDRFATSKNLAVPTQEDLAPNVLAKSGKLLVCASSKQLYVSNDEGATWKAPQSAQTSLPIQLARVAQGFVFFMTPSTIYQSRDGGAEFESAPNPFTAATSLTNVVFTPDLQYWLATDEQGNLLQSCGDCVVLPGTCAPGTPRRVLQANCVNMLPCRADTVEQQPTDWFATGNKASAWLNERWRPDDICRGVARCNGTQPVGIAELACSGAYHVNACQQRSIPDTTDNALKFACALDMQWTNDNLRQFCCTQALCEQNKVQHVADFIGKCMALKDQTPECEARDVELDIKPLTTIGQACSKPIQDFCTANDFANMAHPRCVEWCNDVGTDPTLGGWCDGAMQSYCDNHGKADPKNGIKMDERCGCLLSPVLNARCLDPNCSNRNAYRTDKMKKEMEVECPKMCLQLINVNETGGNVQIDKNTFSIVCTDACKGKECEGKALKTWYDCASGQCRVTPVGQTGVYPDDPSCGGACKAVANSGFNWTTFGIVAGVAVVVILVVALGVHFGRKRK